MDGNMEGYDMRSSFKEQEISVSVNAHENLTK